MFIINKLAYNEFAGSGHNKAYEMLYAEDNFYEICC